MLFFALVASLLPALGSITYEVKPIDDMSLVLDVRSPVPLDFVDAHYYLNDPITTRNLRMIKVNEQADHWKLPVSVLPGEVLYFSFTSQPVDGTGAKTTDWIKHGEKKYQLLLNQITDNTFIASFVPLREFMVEAVDLHYSVDNGATLVNIPLQKKADGLFETELNLPGVDKISLFATYIVNGMGVETPMKEILLTMPVPTTSTNTMPTRNTALGSLFDNLNQRRDGYLRQGDFDILPPLINQGQEPFQQKVVSKGDHLWAIEFIPISTPKFVDANVIVSFQGQVYQANTKLEDVGSGVYSHPPLPLGASDSILYRFTYWLDGMEAAEESPEYSFSPGN